MHKAILGLLVVFSLLSAAIAAEGDAERKPNILLLIGDDMGTETLSCYGRSENPANTPTLDDLCGQGVRFDNFWSQPVCSPTRATMLTGRYGFRTGVGRPTGDRDAMGYFPEILPKPEWAPAEPSRGAGMGGAGMGGGAAPREDAPPDWGLPLNEFTLPMAFKVNKQLGYTTAAIGKWHLADRRNGWEQHPNLIGFDYFAGLIRGFPETYFSWNKVVNGVWSQKTGYAPDDKTDDAINWISAQEDNPWFLWMAFNIPHSPLHLPPENRWRSDWSHIDPAADPNDDSLAYFNMDLEVLDVEIERILDSMSPEVRGNTYIIFMGDNGSGGAAVRPPVVQGRSKGGMYEGGVNVPLFVTGPGVEKGVSKALVNSSDMFLTILEMAGIDPAETVPEQVTLDSVSFMPYLHTPATESQRDYVYADVFAGNFSGVADADFALRNAEFKLLRRGGVFEFYNLLDDPYENANLLDGKLGEREQAQLDALTSLANELRSGT